MRPCPSCPFLQINFEEFGSVARALCAKHGQPEPDFWAVESIRNKVIADARQSGQLLCHQSVYDSEMNPHTATAVPCAGLTHTSSDIHA